jgi:hypothetical protein
MKISISGSFVFGKFWPLGDNKKGLANPTKGFLRIFLKHSSYHQKKKKLKVAKFRQCFPLGCQN